MAVPDFQSIFLPMLKIASDKDEHSLTDAREELAAVFQLTDEELKEVLPSGRQKVFVNRVAWAKVYLTKAGLLEHTKRAHFRITADGLRLLERKPNQLKIKDLKEYPAFREFRRSDRGSEQRPADSETLDSPETPLESIETAYSTLRSELKDELNASIMGCTPSFFENLVLDLLTSMGYGGSRKDAAEAVGKSGDEGIDGIIKEDRLGLDAVYIQAKRWEGSVGRPELQKFVGALKGQRADKGIFITTSSFTKNAVDYVAGLDMRVVLIDGDKLTEYMIDHGVGVSVVDRYEIKKIDMDYFTD